MGEIEELSAPVVLLQLVQRTKLLYGPDEDSFSEWVATHLYKPKSYGAGMSTYKAAERSKQGKREASSDTSYLDCYSIEILETVLAILALRETKPEEQ